MDVDKGPSRHQLSNHALTVSHTRQQSMPHAHENEGHLLPRVGSESTALFTTTTFMQFEMEECLASQQQRTRTWSVNYAGILY